MADNNLLNPITYFNDPTAGRPVALGEVFIGLPGLDPEIEANRVTVNLKEEDGTLVPIAPASQPLTLSAGGNVLFNGSPVQVLIDGDYSIKVLDSLGSQVYFQSNVDVSPVVNASGTTYTLTACSVITQENVQDALTELCNAVATNISNISTNTTNISNNTTSISSISNNVTSIKGLRLSNDADADHDISTATGSAFDSTNTTDLVLPSPIVKQIDAAWTEGTNLGGLFSGAVSVDTWYHFFLIEKDSDGSIDAGFDTSVTAANIPGGYTEFRRIGSVLTDGSSNILGFIQIGGYFIWKTPIEDFDGAGSALRANLTISVPVDVETWAFINILADQDSQTYIAHPDTDDLAPSRVAPPGTSWGNTGATNAETMGQISCLTNTAAQISKREFGAQQMALWTYMWFDFRGQL